MSDQIVLLEGRKEVTTFLLDDGDVTSKDVVTETGQNIGYEYTSKLYPEDTVTISDKSEIGKERVKKYTGDDGEIPIGIVVNDPTVMDNGQRKASVLVLGQLYRLKLASGITDDEYNYVNCFKLASGGAGGEKGDTGDTGPAGPKGDTGDTGPMTIIKGSYDTLEELIAAHPTGQPGDAYIVAGDLYIWEE